MSGYDSSNKEKYIIAIIVIVLASVPLSLISGMLYLWDGHVGEHNEFSISGIGVFGGLLGIWVLYWLNKNSIKIAKGVGWLCVASLFIAIAFLIQWIVG